LLARTFKKQTTDVLSDKLTKECNKPEIHIREPVGIIPKQQTGNLMLFKTIMSSPARTRHHQRLPPELY
jgi:hypothetical protein